MCAVICKVVDRRKMKDKNTHVMRENLLGALTYKIPNNMFVILQQEVKEMQMKFGDMVFMAKTSMYDFNAIFRDHIPGYTNYMNVIVLEDYTDNGTRIINCALDIKNSEFDILLKKKKLMHSYGRSNKTLPNSILIKVPVHEFDTKYRKQTGTLALDYIIKHDKIPFSKEKLLLENAPNYLLGFWYITNNSKLEMLVKYANNEEGKYLKEFLNKGGLKNDEFLHMGIS